MIPSFIGLQVCPRQELLTLPNVDWPFLQWSSLKSHTLLTMRVVFSAGGFTPRDQGLWRRWSRGFDGGSISLQSFRELIWRSFLILAHHVLEDCVDGFIECFY